MSQGTSTEDIRSINLPLPQPRDFNGDVLALGDHVMFAIGRGYLGEGIVVEGTQHPGAVTVQSTTNAARFMTVDAGGTIKIAT